MEGMADEVVKNYEARRAAGEVFMNHMSKTYEERSVSTATLIYRLAKIPPETTDTRKTVYNSPFAINSHGAMLDHLRVFDSIDVQRLLDLAGTAAYANVDDPIFEGATFVGELSETIHFLKSPLKSWNTLLKRARKHKRGERFWAGKTLAQFISDNWLTYRYAIQTSQMDVQDALLAVWDVQRAPKKQPERRTARGYSQDTFTRSVTGKTSGGLTHTYTTQTECTYDVRSMILYQFDRHPHTFGFGLQEIPSTAWEIIPFSFVVDWFANVGAFIKAITPKVGITKLGDCTTTTLTMQTNRSSYWSEGGLLGGRPRIIEGNGGTDEFYKSVQRTRSPGISLGMRLKVSPFHGLTGQKRIADLLSISSRLLNALD